ncbi:MAG: hypothetical protein AAFX54_10575 [Pseudomonadota bacterium]
MTEYTDPAKELAELFDLLNVPTDTTGDAFLASKFGVQPWSAGFYQIVFCIVERIDFLQSSISGLNIDDDLINDALSSLKQISKAFEREPLRLPWNHNGGGINYLKKEHIQTIKMLSPEIRRTVSYPRISKDKRNEILDDIEVLITWLTEHQLKEQDFIRQALLDGLYALKFRLSHLNWLGWGYVLSSLRDVIGAYLALERGIPADNSAPDGEAVLKKMNAFLSEFYKKTNLLKDISENADFILKAYGAASIFLDSTSISGLLPKP